MAGLYTVDDVLAYMDIPMPEDDDFSEDDFEGYLTNDEDNDEGHSGGGGDGGGDGGDCGDCDGGGDDGGGGDCGDCGDCDGGCDEGDGSGDNGGDGDGSEDGDGSDGDGSDGDNSLPEYTQHLGCTCDMTNKAPIDFFQLFFTDRILESIVEQTNLFAQQYMEGHELSRRSRVQQWVRSVHDLAELKRFLALIIIMGLISFPSIEDCWVTSWPFATFTFSSIMSRDRFSLLLRFLHLNDSTKYIPKGQPGYDPLYKLRPLVDPLIANFKAAFNLGREIAVDEGMIGFKGRLWFLQYMPKKPTKWGMKAFVLSDSVTGYTYNWRLYTGMD